MKKLRILIAKVGLDGHDRGAKSVAVGLRDAGMEVIYTGIRQTAESVVSVAVQEDVDAIGISSLAGAHMTMFPKVMRLLEEKGARDIMVFGGGIIPRDDIVELKKIGVGKLFLPGTKISDVVAYLNEAFPN
ncbi:MAG: cobalamin B12-binding domain-containing protein [Deltaproteobacteria bacterium]|nr:cobalamin B12-binding domain-containing protein [Deltaproteobacteria bacterium]